MNSALILLRVLHILCGAYWAGTVFFIAQFLEPVVRGAGPAGAPVMQGLQARGYFAFMPAIAILTILSGGTLMWIDSSGFAAQWMGSGPGMGYSTGALFGVLALAVGLGVLRPAGARLGPLAAQAMQLPAGAERDAQMATVATLRKRVTLGSRVVAALMLVTVLTMAVARYLP